MIDVIFSLLLALSSFFGLIFPQETPATTTTATVVSVIDGDTIKVQIGGTEETVRYIGIDTPEPYRDGEPACYSHEATEENKKLVAGKEVTLRSDREDKDKYGRLLRYVYVGDTFVNAELVEDGFAKTLPIKPNTTHATEFLQLQNSAKEEGRGLWSECAE
jgi:micrococcal nuclease